MHLVPLLLKLLHGSTHRDNIVVRVGRENEYPLTLSGFFGNFGVLWSVLRPVPEWPSRNFGHDFLVAVQVEVLNTAIGTVVDQFGKIMILVVVIGESQERLLCLDT